MTDLIEYLQELTLDDVQHWAGDKIYHRGKGMLNAVSELCLSTKGGLSAKVEGTETYETEVYLECGELTSACSCPYDNGECKHAVAVILATAKQINAGESIPKTTVFSTTSEDIEKPLQAAEERFASQARRSGEEKPDHALPRNLTTLKTLLSKQSKNALVKQLLLLSKQDFEIEESLWYLVNASPSSLSVKSQMTALRRKIKKITAEESWQDYWNHKGHTPDYTPIRLGLDALYNLGAFDEVVELSRELWVSAMEQIQCSDDEGELANELSHSLFFALEALPKTSMKPVEQLLWLIDLVLEDNYGLLQDSDLVYNHEAYQIEHWQTLSTILKQRLTGFSASKDFHYEYKNIVDMLAFIYQKIGDENALLAMMEKEVKNTNNYIELVEAHAKKGDFIKAKKWCLLGFQQTFNKFPGIASDLKNYLKKWYKKEGDFKQVAALYADDFFASPSINSFKAVEFVCREEIATTIEIWAQVRTELLAFLEQNVLSSPLSLSVVWPLPKPEVSALILQQEKQKNFRFHRSYLQDLMIEIALHEQRYDQAVADFLKREFFQPMIDSLAQKLARSVTLSHPETAINVWKACAVNEINQKKASAYQRAAEHLRQLRIVYEKHASVEEWFGYMAILKIEHKRKKRLLEILDNLIDRSDSAKLIG